MLNDFFFYLMMYQGSFYIYKIFLGGDLSDDVSNIYFEPVLLNTKFS